MAPAVITIVLAVVVTFVIWGAAAGRLSANGLVGIRTRATQSSESAWRAAHRAALRVAVPFGVIVSVGCAAALMGIVPGSGIEAFGLVALGFYALGLVASAVVAQRAARAIADA